MSVCRPSQNHWPHQAPCCRLNTHTHLATVAVCVSDDAEALMKVSGGRLVGHDVQHEVLTLSVPASPLLCLLFNPFFSSFLLSLYRFLFFLLLFPSPSSHPLIFLLLFSSTSLFSLLSLLSMSSLSLSPSSSPPCCHLALLKINAQSVCLCVHK